MDPQELITGARWELLKQVASKPATTADLARFLGTTAANANQHLKLLELAGLVTKERTNGKMVNYRLAQNTALVTLLADPPLRAAVPLNDLEEIEMRILSKRGPCERCLRHFILQHEELVQSFLAFGVVQEDEREVQLLVLAFDVRALRKEYANIELNGKRIIIWSHTPTEIEEGIKRGEAYFIDLLRRVMILQDTQ